jgi:SAM-dependent methyltransferase
MYTQDVICPACRSKLKTTNVIQYRNANFSQDSTFNELSILACDSCSFSFVENPPNPDTLFKFYNLVYRSITSPYYIDFLQEDPKQFDARSFSQVSLASSLTDFQDGDVFLDLGPGKGSSFRSAQLLLPAPKLVSIEYSQDAIKFYKHNFKIDNFKDLTDFHVSGQRAKILLMSHSLEHFSYFELPDLLANIRSCLAPGGVGVIEVPHANLPKDRDFLNNDSPHLLFFSKRSLNQLFLNFGFEIIAECMVGASIRRTSPSRPSEASTVHKLRKIAWRAFRKIARQANPDEGALELLNPSDFLLNFGRNPNGGCIRLAIKAKTT